MEKMIKEGARTRGGGPYSVGVDTGNKVIGHACVEGNKIVAYGNRSVWGVRHTELSTTDDKKKTPCAKKRQKKSGRYLNERRKDRVKKIRGYFMNDILSKDQKFFERLRRSFYKDENRTSLLFDDSEYSDKEFHKEYPTIQHLIQAFKDDRVPFDEYYSRKLYLVLKHFAEKRGHFNLEMSSENIGANIMDTYIEFRNRLYDAEGIEIRGDITIDGLKYIFQIKGKKDRIEELKKYLNPTGKCDEYIKAVCGGKFNVSKFCGVDYKKKSVSFAEKNDDDAEMNDIIYEADIEHKDLLDAAEQLYSAGALAGIMNGYKYYCDAMVGLYDKHHEDLRLLKSFVRDYIQEEYRTIFSSKKEGSYASYVHYYKNGTCRIHDGDKFLSNIKKKVEAVKSDTDPELCEQRKKQILDEIENGTFLQKQRSKMNAVVPMQVVEKDMKAVLETAEKHLAFLQEPGESKSLTVKEEILQHYSFRIPSYIGPPGRLIGTLAGEVRPWNLAKYIDLEKRREEYIQSLVKPCTYFPEEKAMPKMSLLYEDYMVFNELASVRIKGHRLSAELKRDIYNDLFTKQKKITKKKLAEYLLKKGLIDNESQIKGLDTEFTSGLNVRPAFLQIFGDISGKEEMLDEICFYGTVWGKDKKMFADTLQKYDLTDDQIKKITGLNFQGWGRLSRKFLTMTDRKTGQTLIEILKNGTQNMMEIINSNEYSFKAEIACSKKKARNIMDFAIEDLDDFRLSAKTKRTIVQVVKILQDIIKVYGYDPQFLVIETTRSEEKKKAGKKKASVSRYDSLKAVYEKMKLPPEEKKEWLELLDMYRADLKKTAVFLWFLQLGKDIYTGESIDYEKIGKGKAYDKDHIIAQSLCKDDSPHNNLVLTYKHVNQAKDREYPVFRSVYGCNEEKFKKRVDEWRWLKEQGLMTEEKFRRLSDTSELTDDDLAGFIQRQLVETSQAVCGLAEVLELYLPNTIIIYNKASNTSDFRKRFHIPKVRGLNDAHHAVDAYLNVITGRIMYYKFMKNAEKYAHLRHDQEQFSYNLSKVYDRDVYNGDELIWKGGDNGSVQEVKKCLQYLDPLSVQKTEKTTGKICDDTLRPASEMKSSSIYLAAKKDRPVEIYGGHGSVTGHCFVLMKIVKKNKQMFSLEAVYIKDKDRLKTPEDYEQYIVEREGYTSAKFVKIINTGTEIEYNGYRAVISSRTGHYICLKCIERICLDNWGEMYASIVERADAYNSFGIDKKEKKDLFDPIDDCNKKPVSDNEYAITKANNLRLFDALLDANEQHCRIGGDISRIREKRDLFERLSIGWQCYILTKLMILGNYGTGMTDLSVLGLPKNFGYIRVSKYFTDEITFIYKSPSGIHEKHFRPVLEEAPAA